MSEIVSREAAIEVLIMAIRDKFPIADWYERLLEKGFEIEDLLQELPPVTPTEKDKRIKELKDLFADMLESAQSVPMSTPTERTGEMVMSKWIPVSEGLPKEEKTVLTCDARGVIVFGRYSKGEWYWEAEACADYWARDDSVIAWMPLPEPYKGGGAG